MTNAWFEETRFYHGIDLGSVMGVNNLSLQGTLATPNTVAIHEPNIRKVHVPIEDLSLSAIRDGSNKNAMRTPWAAATVFKAALFRGGLPLRDGTGAQRGFSPEETAETIRKADVEIEFERIRRIVAPECVSRLACFWLAPANESGRRHIQGMLGQSAYIAKCKIVYCLQLSKSDTDWFDFYLRDKNTELIENYWKGIPASKNPKWEYLVDGAIELVDSQDVEYLRRHRAELGLRPIETTPEAGTSPPSA